MKPVLAVLLILFLLTACSYDSERFDSGPRASSRPSRYQPQAQVLPPTNYHPELMRCRTNACIEQCSQPRAPAWCANLEPRRPEWK
jgi:hypothetical protein